MRVFAEHGVSTGSRRQLCTENSNKMKPITSENNEEPKNLFFYFVYLKTDLYFMYLHTEGCASTGTQRLIIVAISIAHTPVTRGTGKICDAAATDRNDLLAPQQAHGDRE